MGEGQSKERAILGWKLSGSLMSPLPGPSPMRGKNKETARCGPWGHSVGRDLAAEQQQAWT